MKIFSHFSANNILLKPMPFTRELAMEAYLIENENVLILSDDDVDQVQIISAELPVKNGRAKQSSDGRIDLLALYGNEVFGIIELKNSVLTERSFEQLEDYFKEKQAIYSELQKDESLREELKDVLSRNIDDTKWVGILVGTSIERGLQEKIVQGTIRIGGSIPLAAIIINRYRSDNGQVFVTTDTYFKSTYSAQDKTKYGFDGQKLGKGRLVHAIVKKYLSEHPTITFSDLESVFPKNLQGRLGVFNTLERAEEIYSKHGHKRHFLNDEDVLSVDGIKVVVCSQWGIGNIGNIVKIATEKCGYEIKEIQ